MNSALMFSRATDEWSTPRETFDTLNAEFGFDLDAAASRENALCETWLGLDHRRADRRDALKVGWSGLTSRASGAVVWLNPPYSRCREFISKAKCEAVYHGCTVVCLVPARTDTRWFHDYVWDRNQDKPYDGNEVRFIKGRLKFGGAKTGAPFPSMVVIFRPVNHAD